MSGAARCVHLVLGSAAEALEACLAHRLDGEPVVLAGPGVAQLARVRADPPAWLHAVAADVEARGLGPWAGAAGGGLLSDAEWARLVLAHAQCLGWR